MALKKYKRSVCMATFNGEKFVVRQMMSILEQLGSNDEVIVVDDASVDKTVKVIESINDKRIVIIQNETNIGHVKSFEKAISYSTGDRIFLSDQDDLWSKDRVLAMEKYIEHSQCDVVATNFLFMSENESTVWERRKKLNKDYDNAFTANVMKIFFGTAPYFGCAMAFNKAALKVILPFPRCVEAHDLWIALASNVLKNICHDEKPTLYHRIHDDNKTPKRRRTLYKIMKSRFRLLCLLAIALYRRYVVGPRQL